MKEPTILNPGISQKLGKLLFWGNYEECVDIITKNKIHGNSILEERGYPSLIEEVMRGSEKNNSLGQNNHYPLVKFLLDNGADSSLLNKDKYHALYLAASDPSRIKYLELMLQYPINDINVKASYGHTALSHFVKDTYGRIATVSVSLKKQCLNIIEQMLLKGADAEDGGSQNFSIRKIVQERIEESAAVLKLFDKYKTNEKAEATILIKPLPSTLKYPEVGKEIWKTLVPKSGSSDTVQGELLRAIEKLRDEAQRNGNINYGSMHKKLASFVQKILMASPIFEAIQKEEIAAYIALLSKKNMPYTDDDAYDFLTDRICEFYLQNKTLIPNTSTKS